MCAHAPTECHLRYAPALTAVGNMHMLLGKQDEPEDGGEEKGQGHWWGTMTKEITTFPHNTHTPTPTGTKIKTETLLLSKALYTSHIWYSGLSENSGRHIPIDGTMLKRS